MIGLWRASAGAGRDAMNAERLPEVVQDAGAAASGRQPACDEGCVGSARGATRGARDRRAGYRADSAAHNGADRSCDHGARTWRSSWC